MPYQRRPAEIILREGPLYLLEQLLSDDLEAQQALAEWRSRLRTNLERCQTEVAASLKSVDKAGLALDEATTMLDELVHNVIGRSA